MWKTADPQSFLDEKGSLEEKLAVAEYELRLAQEDILKLKSDLLKKTESSFNESSGKTKTYFLPLTHTSRS